MSRTILALFLLITLVVIEIEAQKCRRYETICYPKRGCTTRCIRRGRRDVSEALQTAEERSLEEENERRFEKDVSEEEEKRDADDLDEEFKTRMIADALEEEARDVDDEEEDRDVDDEEEDRDVDDEDELE